MINAFMPLARKDDLVTQNLSGELLVYDLVSRKAHCLNSTSALVWSFCDGTRSIEDITLRINADSELIFSEEVVLLAIEQLKSTDLLVSHRDYVIPSVSRREVIRKAGFAIAVALPIISSIAVPSNVSASASGVPPGGPCISSVDCQSGLCVANVCA